MSRPGRLVLTTVLRGRWRKLQRDGGVRRALGQLASGPLLVLSLAELKGGMTTAAYARLWNELGLGLWSAWVAGAAVVGSDFAWHFRMRPWIARLGFWTTYVIGALLAPTSPLILGGFLAALLAMVIGLHVAAARLPLAAIPIWLLVLVTLRLTSSIRVLTRSGRSALARGVGFAVAFGLAGWNELAHGLPPMHWLRLAANGSTAKALLGTAGLALILPLLGVADGRLTRWDVLQGRSGRPRSTLGAALLGSGVGPAKALSRTAVLSWKPWVWAAAVCSALAFPIQYLLNPIGTAPGMGPSVCALALYLPCWARANLLGTDGPGVWRYLCAGVGPADVLLQRGLALNVLQVVMLLPSVVLVATLGPAGWVGILAMVAFVVASLSVMDAAGLLISRDFPEPDRPSDGSDGLTTGGGWLWLGITIWDTAFVAAFVFAWPSVTEWFWPAAVAVASLFFRWSVARGLSRESANVWSTRTLSRLGATWA